jgi:hypothetical protein
MSVRKLVMSLLGKLVMYLSGPISEVRRSRNLDYVTGEVNTMKAKILDSKLLLSEVLRSKGGGDSMQ